MATDASTPSYYLPQRTLHTPQPISSLSFGLDGRIFAGSCRLESCFTLKPLNVKVLTDDGSLRVYHVSSTRVLKAIRGIGSEIVSVASLQRSGADIGDVWIACGRRVRS